MSKSIIKEKSYEFAERIVDLYKVMIKKNEYVLSKQILRSGTSIGANVEEGLAGQSKKDFIAKMSIASKEARETNYWLKLIKYSGFMDDNIDDLIIKNDEIIKMLTAIVKTSQLSIKTN